MPKFYSIEEYVDTFNDEARKVYKEIQNIMNEINLDVKEKLFAGQIAFYIENNLRGTFHNSPVIIMAFFDDHVNIFASANSNYQSKLPEYKFTEKGTMQIYFDKPLKKELLSKLFVESLGEE